jgi:hypothetical protein
MGRVAYCGICKGLRPVADHGTCGGCGSDVPGNAPTKIEPQRRCPKCTGSVLKRNGQTHQSLCHTCGFSLGMVISGVLR